MKVAIELLASAVFGVIFFGVLLFWPAGTFDYWQAWIFIAVFVVATMVPTVGLAVRYPDAFRRRMRSGPLAETRTVQKLIMAGLIAVVVAMAVVSALDHRFAWSSVASPVAILGNVLVAAGVLMGELVVVQNNYAAATITVEAEQEVVSTGLYGVVRHPMYVGALIMIIGTPLALGSYWGLVAVPLAVLIFAARIADEEKALRENLPGYPEYTEKVQYRLLPYVW